ncbi:MAG: DNA polymerase III subunit beta [Gammaproteobacteria bacterium]|nr:DNA polymerase III subunit beta [Gammaproteobacteria bacterium]
MKFQVQRETLLKPVQAVMGVVERRQTMPVLSNVLMIAEKGQLRLTGTDLEVELVSSIPLDAAEDGEITVPGRKLLDILKALPDDAMLDISLDKDRLVIRSGKSRFTLATLPAAEFPLIEDINTQSSFEIDQGMLKTLFDRTAFSMAQQDVRYYLNGLMLELRESVLRAVATDGHRLALYDVDADVGGSNQQVIVPRKGILELQRLLGDSEDSLKLDVGSNHIRIEMEGLRFTSKLIDGRFPDYERVIPQGGDKELVMDRQLLKEALGRTAILSNEKYRGIRLMLSAGTLKIQAHNPDQEEAEEELEIDYNGEELEIGFNVTYLMDALGAVHGDEVTVGLSDPNSSCLIEEPGNEKARYVVMPMRL